MSLSFPVSKIPLEELRELPENELIGYAETLIKAMYSTNQFHAVEIIDYCDAKVLFETQDDELFLVILSMEQQYISDEIEISNDLLDKFKAVNK